MYVPLPFYVESQYKHYWVPEVDQALEWNVQEDHSPGQKINVLCNEYHSGDRSFSGRSYG